MSEYIKLRDLRRGAVFETTNGVRAVKSEYYYNSVWPHKKETQYQCILLESGEFAHFLNNNDELVREIIL